MAQPFRADHVGSLLRPPELLQARKDVEEGKITQEQFKKIEDDAVLKAIDLQKQAGIDVFTEGEYRRTGWSTGIRAAIEGMVPTQSNQQPAQTSRILNQWMGPNGELANNSMTAIATPMALGEKLRQTKRVAGEEAAFLKAHAPGPWKITMPGAVSVVGQLYQPGITDKVYSKEELTNEVVEMLKREVNALIDDGVSYIQLDSLHYVERLSDKTQRPQMIAAGEDPDAYLSMLIAADNAVLNDAQGKGITVGLHMCRGNNRSAWHAEGDYEPIAERAFAELNVDRFLLEYDTQRAGGFEPLRFVPKNKMVVLGLISSKEARLESVDELRRRIDEAAKYVPIENLAISPQCGFASTMLGNLLTWDEQRAKLGRIAETARAVWGNS